MKKYAAILSGIFFFSSCDPDVSGEGINLPYLEFGIKVFPDTAYIKVGDTLTISASISNTLDDGVTITDGKAVIGAGIAHSHETPVETFNFHSQLFDEYLDIFNIHGGVNIHSSGMIREFQAVPIGDSIKFELKLIPKKTGTFNINSASMFFEGSQGKTRTYPYFDVGDLHWDLTQIPGSPPPKPEEQSYNKSYWFAVYE